MNNQDFAAEREALHLEYQDKMARHYGVSFEAWLAHELTESRQLRAQETARFLGVMMDARRVLRDWAQRPLPDMKHRPDTAMCPACLGDGPGSSCKPCGGTGRVPVSGS